MFILFFRSFQNSIFFLIMTWLTILSPSPHRMPMTVLVSVTTSTDLSVFVQIFQPFPSTESVRNRWQIFKARYRFVQIFVRNIIFLAKPHHIILKSFPTLEKLLPTETKFWQKASYMFIKMINYWDKCMANARIPFRTRPTVWQLKWFFEFPNYGGLYYKYGLQLRASAIDLHC